MVQPGLLFATVWCSCTRAAQGLLPVLWQQRCQEGEQQWAAIICGWLPTSRLSGPPQLHEENDTSKPCLKLAVQSGNAALFHPSLKKLEFLLSLLSHHNFLCTFRVNYPVTLREICFFLALTLEGVSWLLCSGGHNLSLLMFPEELLISQPVLEIMPCSSLTWVEKCYSVRLFICETVL